MSTTATFLNTNKLTFFRTYPVVKIGGETDVKFKAAEIGSRGGVGFGEGDVHTVQSDLRVSYCTFLPEAGGYGTITTPTNSVHTALQLQKIPGGGAIPLYFLPYDLNHNRRMTLTDRQGVGNVAFFLTDMVDGCSVYVEGAPTKPTVYHINANAQLPEGMKSFPASGTNQEKMDVWNLKWAFMDNRFQTEGTIVKSLGGRVGTAPMPNVQPASKVESRDYMLLTKNQTDAYEGMLNLLQNANRAPRLVNGKSVDSMAVWFTQGTIFGIMTGGSWAFYVQKRVLVEYFHHHSNYKMVKLYLSRADDKNRRQSLGKQWIIRAVDQFWPTVNTGRLVV